ncbi:cytochrome o ubiquinol oxidase subunit III [Candidatus Saccharibacteria bacterium RIFCSPHIGHO2_12_FULL_42_8]|nr:MAG: cytochrome o ubiquinol oxidase subunit III [Candidatus Saccharibacteria bacterium RIFCSPHIGHO2_12_FULL_42_8]
MNEDSKTNLGFWIYLMTDCIVFASLFATYAVLQGSTFGGPGGKELFELPFVLTETLILLTSSFLCGLAVLAARKHDKGQTLTFLGITFLLGLAFVGMEINEFIHLIGEGNSWQQSAFLSAFFTLVGTHGLHITIGLIWATFLGLQIYIQGLKNITVKRLFLFSLFWHFLDIVWIFIFTIVYLMGVAL